MSVCPETFSFLRQVNFLLPIHLRCWLVHIPRAGFARLSISTDSSKIELGWGRGGGREKGGRKCGKMEKKGVKREKKWREMGEKGRGMGGKGLEGDKIGREVGGKRLGSGGKRREMEEQGREAGVLRRREAGEKCEMLF